MKPTLTYTMKQTASRRTLQVLALGIVATLLAVFAVALAGSTALAQSTVPYSGPGGAGSGIGGMLGVGLPLSGQRGVTGEPGRRDVGGTLRSVAATLINGQAQTVNVGGQLVAVPATALQTVGYVLSGAAPSTMNALERALAAGGVPAATANPLAKALAKLRAADGSYASVVDAANAYNAAVTSLSAGAPVPAILVAVRAALGPLMAATQ